MDEFRDVLEKFERREMPDLWPEVQHRRLLPEPRHRRPSRLPIVIARRHPWRLALAAAAAAGAVAVGLPLVLLGGSGGADPAAAGMLRQVARRAAAQPPQSAPGPGQYLYTKTQSMQTYLYVVGDGLQNFSFTQPLTQETWIGPDSSGRILETGGPISFLTPQDQAAWVAAGSPRLNQTDDQIFGPGELLYQDYSNLPTDPLELLSLIEQRKVLGGPAGDWETFDIVGDLLRETYTSPAVRGALYEVAADLPGVEFVGRTQDASGRPGVAVAYTHEGVRTEMIFDPKTAELLGETSILTEDSDVNVESGGPGAIYGLVGKAGTIAYEGTYLVSGVADSINARP